MKHRIGKVHTSKKNDISIVTDKKVVKEEDFYKQLKESLESLWVKNIDSAIEKAKCLLNKGEAITVDDKYFIITKR